MVIDRAENILGQIGRRGAIHRRLINPPNYFRRLNNFLTLSRPLETASDSREARVRREKSFPTRLFRKMKKGEKEGVLLLLLERRISRKKRAAERGGGAPMPVGETARAGTR